MDIGIKCLSILFDRYCITPASADKLMTTVIYTVSMNGAAMANCLHFRVWITISATKSWHSIVGTKTIWLQA